MKIVKLTLRMVHFLEEKFDFRNIRFQQEVYTKPL